METRRREKPWFEMSKTVIDDYGPKIGAHGVAVYACLVRMCQGGEDGSDIEFDDLETMLALEQSEIAQALDSLVNAEILRRDTRVNGDGTTTTSYVIVDLAPQYYGLPLAQPAPPEPAMQPIPPKTSPTRKGLVYVVEGEGYFKIGCTTNFSERIKALTVKAPFAMVVHLVIPSLDIYGTEQELHRRFAAKHRRGEWFNLGPQDLEDLRHDYAVLDPAFLSTE